MTRDAPQFVIEHEIEIEGPERGWSAPARPNGKNLR